MEAAPSRLPAGAMMVHHRRRAVVRLFIWRAAEVIARGINNRPEQSGKFGIIPTFVRSDKFDMQRNISTIMGKPLTTLE